MIIDIIPMPIQVRTGSPIEMSSPLWINNNLIRCSEELWLTSRDLKRIDGLYRYKFIECPNNNTVIEHIVLSLDELNPMTLGLNIDRNIPVDLYPISTKIISSTGRPAHAYRHRQGIQAILSKLTGCNKNEFASIHEMFINMAGSGMWINNRLDMAQKFLELKEQLKPRLHALISSEEVTNDLLMNNMGNLAYFLETDNVQSCDSVFLMDLIEDVCGVPNISSIDKTSKKIVGKQTIPSHDLRPLVMDRPFHKRLRHLVATHDIFAVDDTVEYSLPDNTRWELLPLIDRLHILPYTDVSITISPNDLHVNYAVSMVSGVPDIKNIPESCKRSEAYNELLAEHYRFKTPTYLQSLAVVISKLALRTGLNPRTVSCNIVKTFREDVYIEFYENDNSVFDRYVEANCIPTKYYLDLTMCTLGTRGIVTEQMYNSIIPEYY